MVRDGVCVVLFLTSRTHQRRTNDVIGKMRRPKSRTAHGLRLLLGPFMGEIKYRAGISRSKALSPEDAAFGFAIAFYGIKVVGFVGTIGRPRNWQIKGAMTR